MNRSSISQNIFKISPHPLIVVRNNFPFLRLLIDPEMVDCGSSKSFSSITTINISSYSSLLILLLSSQYEELKIQPLGPDCEIWRC